jgi:hypothetical protein
MIGEGARSAASGDEPSSGKKRQHVVEAITR